MRIRVDPEGAPHTLALDDAPISPAAESAALPIDPGEHVVTVARAGSGEVTRERFSIQERELRSIQLSLPPPLAIAAPAQPEARSGGVLASPWFWTAVGVVVIGGTIATVCVATSCGAGNPTTSRGSIGSVKLP